METQEARPDAAAIAGLPRRLRALLPSSEEAIAGARIMYVVRSHVLERMAKALKARQLQALLVKGSGLALSVYPSAWQREMGDIDIIVSRSTRDRVVAALKGAGFVPVESDPRRRFSESTFAELGLVARVGALSVLVEVHTSLDKIGARPVDYDAITARATPAPELSSLLLPSLEDHALLVTLHAAGSVFRHPIGFVDLELLFHAGADFAIVAQRARAWRLDTALFIMLGALRGGFGSSIIPASDVEAFAPGCLRHWALARYYAIGDYPVATGSYDLGWTWMMRQLPLRDDSSQWMAALARYSLLRVGDAGAGLTQRLRESFARTRSR